MAKATKSAVVKAWSDKVGRKDQYDVREVEAFDGTVQTQLIDKDTGSISIAVDGGGDEALQKLLDEAGSTLLDAGVSPKESTGSESKVQTTSRGVAATPTQPAAQSDPAEKVVVHMETPEAPQSGDVPTQVDPVTGGSTVASGEESGNPDPNSTAGGSNPEDDGKVPTSTGNGK